MKAAQFLATQIAKLIARRHDKGMLDVTDLLDFLCDETGIDTERLRHSFELGKRLREIDDFLKRHARCKHCGAGSMQYVAGIIEHFTAICRQCEKRTRYNRKPYGGTPLFFPGGKPSNKKQSAGVRLLEHRAYDYGT